MFRTLTLTWQFLGEEVNCHVTGGAVSQDDFIFVNFVFDKEVAEGNALGAVDEAGFVRDFDRALVDAVKLEAPRCRNFRLLEQFHIADVAAMKSASAEESATVRLLDEDESIDWRVEEGIFYVDLTDWEMLRGSDGEENANGGVAADGCEGLIEINAVTLIEFSDNPAGFKSFNGSVSYSLDTEDPLVGEDTSPLQRDVVSEDPCFAGFEGSDFSVHSDAPLLGIWICEGLARGFGFNRFWWAKDSSVEAEYVKSGEAGAVPLISGDFHHIVVGVVAAGGGGAEERVVQGLELSAKLVVVFVAPWVRAGMGIRGVLIRECCLCFVFRSGEAARWALVVSDGVLPLGAVSVAVPLKLADGMVLDADAEMHAPAGTAF
ncbi:unnamed protein product [Closterium sp. NIES-53]